ncbi:MAG: copper homeostasis protein CutC [Bacteroidales bacterium]|nr:copper homeostasis protein CutC [Bacteroidales bacterium]
MQLEACIETIDEAVLAQKYQCKRIEVCSALDLGGLTPSYSFINTCSKLSGIESHILIRPRAGNFVYTSKELNLMQADILSAAEAGAKGVVFGCLCSANSIELDASKRLLDFAKSLDLNATFHRAIDFVQNYEYSIQQLIDLGFDRVLTSGQKQTAFEGLSNIKSILKQFSNRIEIMAGSGIDAKNVAVFQSIGIHALHFTIRKNTMENVQSNMGIQYQADETKLKAIINKIKHYENNTN